MFYLNGNLKAETAGTAILNDPAQTRTQFNLVLCFQWSLFVK
jgi:hypothetical protein